MVDTPENFAYDTPLPEQEQDFDAVEGGDFCVSASASSSSIDEYGVDDGDFLEDFVGLGSEIDDGRLFHFCRGAI